jgi:hypothetical protein
LERPPLRDGLDTQSDWDCRRKLDTSARKSAIQLGKQPPKCELNHSLRLLTPLLLIFPQPSIRVLYSHQNDL